MNFCRLYKQKKEKNEDIHLKHQTVQNITWHNDTCGICQSLGNYMHLGNWIHLLPRLFAIRYRKYTCYVRRGHSLTLKCLKIRKTSSFCPSRVQMHMVLVIQKRTIDMMFEPEHGPEYTALGCQALSSPYGK